MMSPWFVGTGGGVAGMVGNRWDFDNFAPMEAIPTTVKLTTYAGETLSLAAAYATLQILDDEPVIDVA